MIRIEHGDSRDVLPMMAEASVDACVTDPPYSLTARKKGGSGVASVNLDSPYGRARIGTGNGAGGFMGQKWDTGETAFDPAFWAEVLRVLKPGAFLLAMGGDRTFHRLAVAIEDAGFEIRGTLAYVYGSGFPKSHNVTKALLALPPCRCNVAEVGGDLGGVVGAHASTGAIGARASGDQVVGLESNGASPTSEGGHELKCKRCGGVKQENIPPGLGTALKPAMELICLARKPLAAGTVAANVLAHGTGALNIDASRITTSEADQAYIAERIGGFNNTRSIGGDGILGGGETMDRAANYDATKGRWPANLIHDGSDEVLAAFPEPHGAGSAREEPGGGSYDGSNGIGFAKDGAGIGVGLKGFRIGDNGSAARFFYSAKADATDRLQSKHPTVKPVDLMAYLCRLVTPPGGLVLDPFAGSGTTGMACMREGFDAILIEREAEYVADIRRRLAHVEGTDTPLFQAK